MKYETAVLLFAKEPHVSFTNNRAERDLRMAKVKQKISGCFRTEQYAHAYFRISSYLQSTANLGYNLLVAIQMALAGSTPGVTTADRVSSYYLVMSNILTPKKPANR